MDENTTSITNEISNHRKMLATPALKILADLDHSEKSFIVLISVMDRCCKETNNQGVFIGASTKNNERKLGLGIFLSTQNSCNVLTPVILCSFHQVVPWKIFRHLHP